MCGIFGYAGGSCEDEVLERMAGTLYHRGPDEDGFFSDNDVAFGIRRLSIIDVVGGSQPLYNETGSIALVANGEIYNYRELTEELTRDGHRFTSHSDVEVILHLYEKYGKACVKYLRGMFAFALYDRESRELVLGRDRLGIKPLYYRLSGGRLAFASEIKAILEYPGVKREPDHAAIDDYLAFRYVPGPGTLFRGIRKLPPGHLLCFKDKDLKIEKYWDPEFSSGPYKNERYYQQGFEALFEEAVKMRLMSEVPLGAFLSGGIDSSSIVAAMSSMLRRQVKTFSVGFDWAGDELDAAREVANLLKTDHHEVICHTSDLARLPQIIYHLDEPVGDAIVIPMFILSEMAKKHVTVVLSGEGADETMAGYLPHKVMSWTGKYTRWTPLFFRKGLVEPIVKALPAKILNILFSYPAELGEKGRRKVLEYLHLASRKNAAEEYAFLISLFDRSDKESLYARDSGLTAKNTASFRGVRHDGKNKLNEILSLQYDHWLADDILMKQDKMSMAHSLEARVPFLDHKLVEFLMQAPPGIKLRGFREKAVLRNYLTKKLSGKIASRKKRAFYIPVDQYFGKGKFREIVETCLSEESVRRRGYFSFEYVKSLREQVSSGDFLYGKQVFSLVALELWHRIYIDRESGWDTGSCT